MNNPIKDLLAEIEKAGEKAIKQWMATTDEATAALRIGEANVFKFVIDRLKSIIEAKE